MIFYHIMIDKLCQLRINYIANTRISGDDECWGEAFESFFISNKNDTSSLKYWWRLSSSPLPGRLVVRM